MTNESETVTPWKFKPVAAISARPTQQVGDHGAGSALTTRSVDADRGQFARGPVITSATPASTPARIGTDSTAFHSSQLMSSDGSALWVSVASRPMPGKCLTVAASPALW